MTDLRETAMASKAWPFEEARKLVKRFDKRPPEKGYALFETAYALSCDVAAADGELGETEMQFLEEIRWELSIGRLNAAAIERGARARHMTV